SRFVHMLSPPVSNQKFTTYLQCGIGADPIVGW
ncbi:uncharacterized protein METZ01_LOCUS82319, partial [marine metagenome]